MLEVVTTSLSHFLNMLCARHDVSSDDRKQIAAYLLATPDCCLRRINSDIALKCKRLYKADLQYVAKTGLLTAPLHAFLAAWREAQSGECQELEGWNLVLKVMTDRAPHMGKALANARMSI